MAWKPAPTPWSNRPSALPQFKFYIQTAFTELPVGVCQPGPAISFVMQYFAPIEPQPTGTPCAHPVCSTISRNGLRKVLAATHHQVWWQAVGPGALSG